MVEIILEIYRSTLNLFAITFLGHEMFCPNKINNFVLNFGIN